MKTKILTLLAVLSIAIFSSCSKDDEVNLPPLTTQDFISICGMTESQLDAKMSGYKKNALQSNTIVYTIGDSDYILTENRREVFFSVVMSNGYVEEVSASTRVYPTLLFNDVKNDLIALYPNVDFDDIEWQLGRDNIRFTSDNKAFLVSQSSDFAILQISIVN